MWSGRGSNPRPSHCERDALPTELPPHRKARDSSIAYRDVQSITRQSALPRRARAVMIKPMLALGTRAPEFTLPDQDGRNVSLTTLLNYGPLGFGVRRGTYLIDQGRHIRDAVLADFRIAYHEAFVRRIAAMGGPIKH